MRKLIKPEVRDQGLAIICWKKNSCYGLWTIAYGLIALLAVTTASAQTQTNNYVITRAPRIAGITNDSLLTANSGDKTKVQTTIQYVDGLGRPIQTIQKQASPLGYDMIQPQAYDQYGREVTKYLPYSPQTGTAGSFRPNAVSADQGAYYTSPPANSGVGAITDPFAQTAFDNSPLSRPVEQGALGPDWQLGSHTVKMVYTLNNSTLFSADTINGNEAAMYYTTINSDLSQTLHANGYYTAGELTVTISKDENWISGRAGTVEEYKDIDGHVVLKRQYNYASSAVQVLSTYYVYDDLGRLAFVLPPASGADGAGTISTATLNNLCYQYVYDERSRPIRKHLPGKGWENTVYNIMDQPVATQDSLQRAAKTWLFTKYDALGRAVISGIWNNGGTSISRASLQTTLNAISTNLYESSVSTGNGYTNVAWPTTNVTTTLSINYYDGYANAPGMPSAYTAPTGANMATRGQLTATKTAVLNTSDMLWMAHYYDYWGRNLESYAQHYLGGTANSNNYDAINTTYDFTNAPTTTTRKHWTSASTSNPLVTIYNKYVYDWAGRKQRTWEQITNTNLTPDTLRLVSQSAYNEIGQLKFKYLHSRDSVNFLQKITYFYNERGWLQIDSSHLFAMRLYYNTAGSKAWNGNIMYQYWGTPGNLNSYYIYAYDRLNRLTSGVSADNYKETGITYDLMGNITALNRYQAGTQIDQLSYTYSGTNQVQSINDASGNDAGLLHGGWTYLYDGNGNLLSSSYPSDATKNKSTSYNLLNLPIVATIPAGTAAYTYDAIGTKLRKADLLGGVSTTTDYISGIQYDGTSTTDTLSFIQTEEGRALHNGTSYDYQYFLNDNLGNTRVTFNTKTGTAKVIQQDDYYPFGLEINRTPGNPKNEYLYNKKELQEGLGQYDYGARFYDPVIGRWTTIDPLAEVNRRWSPYNYVENDPIRLIDPDGMNVDYGGGAYGGDLYTGADAENLAWGLKIAGETTQQGKDKDRADAKAQSEKWKSDILSGDGWKKTPKLNPLSGFWAKVNYVLNGRSFNGVSYDAEGNPFGYTPITGSPDLISGPIGEASELTHAVYIARNIEGDVEYVGITNNIIRRAVEQLAAKGIKIVPLIENLRPEDARAVEQAPIEIHGLEKKGRTLINLINSISKANPKYAKSLARGYELLEWIGYYPK